MRSRTYRTSARRRDQRRLSARSHAASRVRDAGRCLLTIAGRARFQTLHSSGGAPRRQTFSLAVSSQLRSGSTTSSAGSVGRRPSPLSATARTASTRPSPRTRPGADPRSWLEDRWDELAAEEAAALGAAWAPAVAPPSDEWKGYQLTRSRTIRRLLPQVRTEAGKGPSPNDQVSVEHRLIDVETGLYGTVDRLEQRAGDIHVIDLKTSLRLDEPKEQHRRQLHLYAVLAHRTTGQSPRTVAVETTDGRRLEEELQPADAERTLAEAVGTVRGKLQRSRRSTPCTSCTPPSQMRSDARGASTDRFADPTGRSCASNGGMGLWRAASSASHDPGME